MTDFIGVSPETGVPDPNTSWGSYAQCLRVSHPREITYPFRVTNFEMDTTGTLVECRVAVMLYLDVNGDGETLKLVEGSVMPLSSQPSKRIIASRQVFAPGRYALGFWTEKSFTLRIDSDDLREMVDDRPICRKGVSVGAWPRVLTVETEVYREQFPRVHVVVVPNDPTVPDPGPTPLGPFLGADLMETYPRTGWKTYANCLRISQPHFISFPFRLSELRIDRPGVDSVKKPTRMDVALYKKTDGFTYRIVAGSKVSLTSVPSKQFLRQDFGFPIGEYCLGIWTAENFIIRINRTDRMIPLDGLGPRLRRATGLSDVVDVSTVGKREAFPRFAVLCKGVPFGFPMMDEDGTIVSPGIEGSVVIMDELLRRPPDILHTITFVNSSASPPITLPRALLLDSPLVAREEEDITLWSTTPLPSTKVIMEALLGSTPKLEDLHTLYNFFVDIQIPALAYVCCAYVKKLVTELSDIPQLGDDALTEIPNTRDVAAFNPFSLAVLNNLGALITMRPPLAAVISAFKGMPPHVPVIAAYRRHVPEYSTHRMFSGIRLVESFGEFSIGLFARLHDERIEPTVILVASGGGLVPAHLEVLLTRSKYFRNIMTGTTSQKSIYMKTGRIAIPELEVDVLRAYLEFIYLGQLRELKGESALYMLLKLLTYASRVGDIEFMAFATPSISSILCQMSIIEIMQVTLSSGPLLLDVPDEVSDAWKANFARRMHDSFSGVDGFTRTQEAMGSIMDAMLLLAAGE